LVADFRDELKSFHVRLINHAFLDWFTNGDPAEEMAEYSLRVYYWQLVLIEAEQTELMEAVGNYLAASANAVRYQQAGLVNETSLQEYSDELRTLWTHLRKKLELQGTLKAISTLVSPYLSTVISRRLKCKVARSRRLSCVGASIL
jgi:hypothetical protein